jgi:hypothetical protein
MLPTVVQLLDLVGQITRVESMDYNVNTVITEKKYSPEIIVSYHIYK